MIRVFLNGFNLNPKSGALQISAAPTNLQATNLTIKVTMGTLTIVDRVALSWIAFAPTTASFVSYGGQVSRNQYSGSVSSDISSTIYQSQYTLYGLNLISIISGKAISFSSSITNDFVLTISSSIPIDSFSLVYIAVGPLPSSICANCGAENIANGNLCVSQCPTGTYSFTYKDGGVACRTCSSDLGLILVGGRCVEGKTTTTTTTTTTVVATGPISSGTQTTSSGSTSTQTTIPATTQTTGSSSAQTTSTATTQSTSTSTQSTSTATSQTSQPVTTQTSTTQTTTAQVSQPSGGCFANSYWNGNECVCEVGFVFVNGKCETPNIAVSIPVIVTFPGARKGCNTTTSVPVVSNQCSGQNEVWNGSACVCSSGFVRVNGVCATSNPTPSTPTTPTTPTTPSTPTTPTTPTTPSNPGSVSCGANSYDNGLGVCVCNAGFYKSGNDCVQGTPCGVNSVRRADGSCQCLPGFTNYNGVCSQCPPGAFWSSASNRCVFVCGQNSAYSATANACVCLSGFGLMGGLCQVCPSNYFISNGYCVTCPVNSNYNSKTANCDCNNGFFTN